MELEIKKLADVIEWADGIIRDAGFNEEKYKSDALTAYCHVKAHELWRIREVVLEGMERHSVYTNALNADIVVKGAKIELMQKELDGRKAGYAALKARMDSSLAKKDEEIEELNKEVEKRCKDIVSQAKTICKLEKECEGRKKTIELLDEKVERQRENLNALNKTLEMKTKEIERLIAVKNNQGKEIKAHEDENARLTERIIELKRPIEKCKDYDTSLIDSLRINNDDLKEKLNYWINQERIRTDQLRATERKVEELHKHIENIEHLKKKEDDHGRAGFEEYIRFVITEEEGKFKEELNKRFSEEVAKISRERTEEELTKAKLNAKFGVGGIVDDFKEETEVKYKPSEINRFIGFLKEEVDKKRIVDISEGVEKNLGVSRELFDFAIKALVYDGYREIIGRIPQATNSYVYMDMHVLATPDVETKETANAENIKSLDFDIPCGEDAIE